MSDESDNRVFSKELPQVKIEVVSIPGWPSNLKNKSRYRSGYYKVRYVFKARDIINWLGGSRYVYILIPWTETKGLAQPNGMVHMDASEIIIDARYRIVTEDGKRTDYMHINFRSLTTLEQRAVMVTIKPKKR